MILNLDNDIIQKLIKSLTTEEHTNVMSLLTEADECGLLHEVLQEVVSLYYNQSGYLDVYDCFYSSYYEWVK